MNYYGQSAPNLAELLQNLFPQQQQQRQPKSGTQSCPVPSIQQVQRSSQPAAPQQGAWFPTPALSSLDQHQNVGPTNNPLQSNSLLAGLAHLTQTQTPQTQALLQHVENIQNPNVNLPAFQPPSKPVPTVAPTQIPNFVPPDASNITTYPAALKHIVRLLSLDPSLTTRIRNLIDRQEKHEKQWWFYREELCSKLEKRGEGRRKVREVLKTVGARLPRSVSAPETEAAEEARAIEEDKRELQAYDRKVYDACREMEKSMGEDLAQWGIPFFGREVEGKWMRGECQTDKPNTPNEDAGATTPEGQANWREELMALRRRVVGLLEDLCKEG